MATNPLLDVRDLRVDIPTASGMLHAVRGVDIQLEKGETLGIVGESGCGKSLTALALMGLLPKTAIRTAERMRFADIDLLRMSERRIAQEFRGDRAAMIFQEPMTSLNPVYTIGRQLTEALTLHKDATQQQATARAIDLLERVGITGAERRLGQYPHQLSGGQRQRVLIAMALMNDPELIVADEPTTALDVTIQAQILRLLADLQRELGMAMILITHDLGVVSRVTDKVAVMYAGKIVETGTMNELVAQPRHPYTRGLLECIPEAGQRRPGAHLGSIPGIVPSLIGDISGCAFRSRCRYAVERCRTDPVPTQDLSPGRRYMCVHGPATWREMIESGARMQSLGEVSRASRAVGQSVLAVEDVRCRFPVRRGIFGRKRWLGAVNGVTLALRRGETLALVGESGCGKSTLARILLGLQPIEAGTVSLDGEPMGTYDPKVIAGRVQAIFQDPYSSLNPRKTIGATIRRPLDIHQLGDMAERQKRVAEIMDLVGLPRSFYHRYPNQISGGQRQRVAIARAIIMHPDVVICDEPTSALDVSIQAQILNLLLELRERLGLTYLLISHNLAIVEHMATRVAVMYLGRIVELGEARRVFAKPEHPYTRALLQSSMTVAPGNGIPDNALGHNYPNALDIPSGCSFHPRCPQAMPQCSEVEPSDVPLVDGFVRCLLHGRVAADDSAPKMAVQQPL